MDCYRREKQPPNRWGCKPSEDVCMAHHEPLACRHGCDEAKPHQCKDRSEANRLTEDR